MHAGSAASRTSRLASWVLRTSAARRACTAAAREAWTRGASNVFVSPLTREAPPPRAKDFGNSRMLLRMLLGWLLGAREANADVPAPRAPPVAPRAAPV